MFSLKEIEPNKFMYRCHECGWESEAMTKQEATVRPPPPSKLSANIASCRHPAEQEKAQGLLKP